MLSTDQSIISALESLEQNKLEAIQQLPGGRNNAIRLLKFESGNKYVLKDYGRQTYDGLSRLLQEWNFIKRLEKFYIRNVPHPIQKFEDLSCAVYSYVRGTKLKKEEIKTNHIKETASFIISLSNVDSIGITSAKGAHFCLGGHIREIDERINKCVEAIPQHSEHPEYSIFVNEKLRPTWETTRNRVERKSQTALFDKIKQYLSPSDFGFHNILFDRKKLNFIDFEYGGKDDLAKLVADFSLTPDTHILPEHADLFKDLIMLNIKLDNAFSERVELLKYIGKIKWTCIVLNDFISASKNRRKLASVDLDEKYLKQQMGLANNLIEKSIEENLIS